MIEPKTGRPLHQNKPFGAYIRRFNLKVVDTVPTKVRCQEKEMPERHLAVVTDIQYLDENESRKQWK